MYLLGKPRTSGKIVMAVDSHGNIMRGTKAINESLNVIHDIAEYSTSQARYRTAALCDKNGHGEIWKLCTNTEKRNGIFFRWTGWGSRDFYRTYPSNQQG